MHGWLYNSRESGKLLFPIFRDGTGTVQGVAHVKSVAPAVFEALKGLTQESSVIVTGKVRADKRAPGGFELDVEDVQVVQRVPESDPYPITFKEHGVDFLMEHRHLWVRSPRQSAILRITGRNHAGSGRIFRYEWIYPHRSADSDAGGVRRDLDAFSGGLLRRSGVSDTVGQLYIESTALALGKVYSFGPTFRAEKSKTRRHLTEFWMVEPEVAYCDLDGLLELAENFLSHIVQSVLKNRAAELTVIGRDPEKLKNILPPFPRLRYDKAVEMLNEAHKKGELEQPFEYGNDFGSPDETWLSSQFDRPVMVASLPGRCESFLHGARSAGSALCALRRCSGAGGLRRGHWRVAARFKLRTAQRPHRAAQSAQRGLSVVPRSAPLRIACRMPVLAWGSNALWHGYALWITCGRRFLLRARCIGFTRKPNATRRPGCRVVAVRRVYRRAAGEGEETRGTPLPPNLDGNSPFSWGCEKIARPNFSFEMT